MTSDGKSYTYVYDAFGRLRFIKNLTTGNVIEEYTYNALNQRVGQHYDASANGSVGSEDPWLNFVYDDKWRIVATGDPAHEPTMDSALGPEPSHARRVRPSHDGDQRQ